MILRIDLGWPPCVSVYDAFLMYDQSQGKQYFDCRPNYGIFVRPGSCTVLDEPPPLPVGGTW